MERASLSKGRDPGSEDRSRTSGSNSMVAERIDTRPSVSHGLLGTAAAPVPAAASRPGSPPSRFEKWLLRKLLTAVGNPPMVLLLWNGEAVCGPDQPASDAIQVHIHDRRTLWKIVADPFFQFPESYAAGRVSVEGDLERLMCLVADSAANVSKSAWWFSLTERVLHWGARNTLAGSQANVHHHYDIGNDFYRLWLDENLLYTCAYFEEPSASLEAAQCAKMDHVCRKLVLQPGESVIEAGCGWGGFAIHMAKNYGVKVRAYNISREQIAESRRRAQAEGLTDRVEFILDDWRNITGTCDVFVSIGMLEHVGTANYRLLGDVIDRCLSSDGRGLIHTIGRNRPAPLDPWIERRIFPGAYPPAISQMSAIFEQHEFSVLELENLRMHYAKTLQHWLARYERSIETVRQSYDERFVRLWRMYLAGSIAGFKCGGLQLFQVLFSRPRQNRLPLTRAHQYAHLAPATAREAAGNGLSPILWDEP
jgi:cyclopropane-fatty-acyl-phospholipid synthase